MNNYKFAFIICTNDELLLNECVHYINNLHVPAGYDVELLTIPDAPCITSGYNEAMAATDAKYKIYMHQDVFILNKNFLQDILSIFLEDSSIGMIGMVGYRSVSKDGIMWQSSDVRYGSLFFGSHYFEETRNTYHYSLQKDSYHYVALIDGLLMATSCDLPFDTQHIDGWDFYDAFQSMNYLLHGYHVVVPEQRFPWCIHDDNILLNLFHYNAYREKFVETYKEFLGKSYDQIIPLEL